MDAVDPPVAQHAGQVTPTNARKRTRDSTQMTTLDGRHVEVSKKRKKKGKSDGMEAAHIVYRRRAAGPPPPSNSRPKQADTLSVYSIASTDSQQSVEDVAPRKVPTQEQYRGVIHLKQLQIDDLQDRLKHAHNTIAELQTQQQSLEQRDLHTRQSMLLDLMAIEKKGEEQLRQVQRSKFYLQRDLDELRGESNRQKVELESQKSKCEKAIRESRMFRDEAEHVQALCTTLEEDLHELRGIENEDRRAREEKIGLPPAYGCLEEQGNLPPYKLHTDGGTFDVACAKRAVRGAFNKRIHTAQSDAASLRKNAKDEKERAEADRMILTETSTALADACRSLSSALEYAGESFATDFIQLITTTPCQKRSIPFVEPGYSPDETFTKRETRKTRHERSYVADRSAKLIIDLCWRTTAACELRPTSYALHLQQKARLALEWRAIDDGLLHAIRQAIGSDEFQQGQRQFELQYFETQILALRSRLIGLRMGVNFVFLAKARDWVGEQIEILRMISAREADAIAATSTTPPTGSTSPGIRALAQALHVADGRREIERALAEQVDTARSEIRSENAVSPAQNAEDMVLMEELFQAHIAQISEEVTPAGVLENPADLTI